MNCMEWIPDTGCCYAAMYGRRLVVLLLELVEKYMWLAFEQILFTKLHLFEWNLCLRAKFLYRILQNRRGNIIICKYCPLLNILQCISYMKTDYTQYAFDYSIFLSLLLVTFKRKVKNLLNKANPIKSLLVRIFITSLLWSRSWLEPQLEAETIPREKEIRTRNFFKFESGSKDKKSGSDRILIRKHWLRGTLLHRSSAMQTVP